MCRTTDSSFQSSNTSIDPYKILSYTVSKFARFLRRGVDSYSTTVFFNLFFEAESFAANAIAHETHGNGQEFLARDSIYAIARYMPSPVRLSVTRVDQSKTV